jgi:hypothetical protein
VPPGIRFAGFFASPNNGKNAQSTFSHLNQWKSLHINIFWPRYGGDLYVTQEVGLTTLQTAFLSTVWMLLLI